MTIVQEKVVAIKTKKYAINGNVLRRGYALVSYLKIGKSSIRPLTKAGRRVGLLRRLGNEARQEVDQTFLNKPEFNLFLTPFDEKQLNERSANAIGDVEPEKLSHDQAVFMNNGEGKLTVLISRNWANVPYCVTKR
jgi:hypothetical protein